MIRTGVMWAAALLVAMGATLNATAAMAASEKVLYSFGNAAAAVVEPFAGLIADAAGNLYGTTVGGGDYKRGMAFELSPSNNKTRWTEHVLWSFGGSGDGVNPAAGLIADAAGNLYGTTRGGQRNSLGYLGGTVFELSPPSSPGGQWNERVLWSFSPTDGGGYYLVASLVADAAGNLYGTTPYGGAYALSGSPGGTAFEISPPISPGTQWSKRILWSFGADGDGEFPTAGLIIDAAGNLYGTTAVGGVSDSGTVFELSPPSGQSAQWSEKVLLDGSDSIAGLISDRAGNLHGTTIYDGTAGAGTVFELSPPASQSTEWSVRVLWNFNNTNGALPADSLIADNLGNLYGTTQFGGANSTCPNNGAPNCGTVFELSPPSGQSTQWSEHVLWNFGGSNDGSHPISDLIADAAGNLYGTTPQGGANAASGGTVFKITLP